MKCSLRRNNITFAEFDLSDGDQTLGSANDNTIKVRSSAVSNHHARLVEKGGKVYVQDVGSTNGTVVNGEELKPNSERQINDGDIVVLGDISFKLRTSTPPAEGAPKGKKPTRDATPRSHSKAGKLLDLVIALWKVAAVVAIIVLVALVAKKKLLTVREPADGASPAAADRAQTPQPPPADGADQGAQDSPEHSPAPVDGATPAVQGTGTAQEGFQAQAAAWQGTQPGFAQQAGTPVSQNRPPELEKYSTAYRQQIEATEKLYQDQLQDLFSKYTNFLQTIQDKVMGRGDLEGTLAVKEERAAFDGAVDKASYFSSSQYYSPRPNSPRELIQARRFCESEMASYSSAKERKLATARTTYSQTLLDLQTDLTKRGELEGALAVKAERETL